MISLHVGIDDTDSPRMGCTTYVASLLIEKLEKIGVTFTDYPNLVRLNPNVPWKTRGNGALCLRFNCDQESAKEIMEIITDTIQINSDMNHAGTEPGVAFFQGNRIPKELSIFAKKTIQGLVSLKDALKLATANDAKVMGFNSRRGIIGALAAVGETLDGDHTYELIAYRTLEKRGTPRQIDVQSVGKMSRKTSPFTFNNFDFRRERILITPHGPDPILYGIRGESPAILKRAQKMVRSFEPIERWTVFRTNQGTDAHLRKITSINDVLPYHQVSMMGEVNDGSVIIPGRHVIFSIQNHTGQVNCAAYEPTEDLRNAAGQLRQGDIVEVSGGVRAKSLTNPLTINLEKLRVLKLAPRVIFHNPPCPACAKSMESMGKGQGYRCKKCGLRSKTLKKVAIQEERTLKNGLYVTSPRSQRHLTKPLSRYGLEKCSKPKSVIAKWFWINQRYIE